jgi:hypothetical protein
MPEPKHTFSVNPNDKCFVIDESGETVAHCRDKPTAQLFASAPTLAAENERLRGALRTLLDKAKYAHTRHMRDGTTPATHETGSAPDTCYLCEGITKARAALREGEGEKG